MGTTKTKTTTVGELRHKLIDALGQLPDDTEVTIGGGHLSIYRVKNTMYRADNQTPAAVNVEFNELFAVTLDPDA